MQRWMALYRDDNGEPKQAIIESAGNELPFGSLAANVVSQLPDYNDGGGCFLIEMPADGDTPLVVDVATDEEVQREFVST